MNVTWLGHSAFEFVTAQGTVIYIDPWLEHPQGVRKAAEVSRADIVCVTHHHFDHVGDARILCDRLHATLVAQPEVGAALAQPDERFAAMNIGGTVAIEDVQITMVPAAHSSEHGLACGFILEADGIKIYHAGDTGLTADIQLIGSFFAPDVVLLPIGGVFTMDAAQAARAVELLLPKVAIPMHFCTFPALAQSADAFAAQVGARAKVMRPGESWAVSF